MKIKPDVSASSSDFWYDINNGYIPYQDLLEDPNDVKKVREAIAVLKEFEQACEDSIEDFIQ